MASVFSGMPAPKAAEQNHESKRTAGFDARFIREGESFEVPSDGMLIFMPAPTAENPPQRTKNGEGKSFSLGMSGNWVNVPVPVSGGAIITKITAAWVVGDKQFGARK